MNRIKTVNIIICIVVVFQFFGCASIKKPTQSDVLSQQESISRLDKALAHAKANEVNTYAPEGFLKARDLFKQSIEFVQAGKNEQAIKMSEKGLEIIRQAEVDADNTKKELWEITGYRAKAIKAGAPELYKEAFEAAEKMFRKTASFIVNGDVEKAMDNQPELIEKYITLESNSLEKGLIELAKLSFEQAKQADADKYAPKSFKRAQKELAVAVSIIETDRTQTEKADQHAKIASVYAKNASQISAIVKIFERRDFTNEDIVLWYWQQLEIINDPFGDTINFQQPNHIVVNNMQEKIANLKNSYKTYLTDSQVIEKKQQDYIETLKESHKKEIAKLNKQLDEIKLTNKMEISEKQKTQDKKDRLERDLKQRFVFVQSLFDKTEARVYRKGDNVLISAQGFYFPSGGSEIESSNFGLLNKILSSIKQFPNARLEIDGHTDSVGSGDLNLRLSEKRAAKVASFISNVGHVPAERISHKGYGDTKPVASNKTKEGRTENRRIEVNIINE